MISPMHIKRLSIIFGIFFSFSVFPIHTLLAEDMVVENIQDGFTLSLDDSTIQKGFTASLFDSKMRIGIFPDVFHGPAEVNFIKNPIFEYTLQDGKVLNSEILQYDVVSRETFSGKKAFMVELPVLKNSPYYKRLYFWDGVRGEWRVLPSQSNNKEGWVRGLITFPYARIAVLEDMKVLEEGQASWYGYRKCDCVASPDYPIGTKLKVTSLSSQKYVVATVNDYGPDRSLHPDRVVDLDKVAFKKLAPLGAGIIGVKVEPISNPPLIQLASADKKNVPEKIFPKEISSRAAVLVDAKTGEILYEKNAHDSMPIASLTKLLTAQVFLDTHTPWEKQVVYEKNDDEIGSKLYVYDGEKMTTKDLFSSMLIASTNNAVNTLLESTALGEGQFVSLMREKLKSWGLEKTQVFEPTGLNPKNVSTAYEAALMAKEVLQNKEVLEATTLKSYSFSTINTKEKHVLKNTNPLVGSSDLYLTGGKTGFLEEAGYCLMTRAKNSSGREVIAVVLGAPDTETRNREVKNLLEWGLNEL